MPCASTPPPPPKVDVRVTQKYSFEPAAFKVTLETPGLAMEGEPVIRPFYGRATLLTNTVTARDFTFDWDVAGAIRAARGQLRSTKILIHWTARPEPPGSGQATPMLTTIDVSLDALGHVAVAGVTTAPPAATVDPAPQPPPTTQPVAPPQVLGEIVSGVSHIAVDTAGTVRLTVWVVGAIALAAEPKAMSNVGLARCRPAPDRPNHIDLEWTRSEREQRPVVPVSVVVTWGGSLSDGGFLAGRTVVQFVAAAAQAAVTEVTTSTRTVPPPAPLAPAGAGAAEADVEGP